MSATEASRGLRLLVVEDGTAGVRPVSATLESAPRVRIDREPRLTAALRRLSSIPYDAVLLDLELPEARDLQALAAVRRAAPEVPVLVSSALVDEELALRALRAGAQDYLVKGHPEGGMFVRSIHDAIERQQQRKARGRSMYDRTTGLPTAALLRDRLQQAIAERRRNGGVVALLRVRIETGPERSSSGMEPVTLGLATRLRRGVRAGDTVARTGVDEFAVLLAELEDAEAAAAAAARITARANQPFRIAGCEVRVAVSVGVAVVAEDGATPQAVLDRSGRALAGSTRRRGAGVRFHQAELDERISEWRELAVALRAGLRRGELSIELQPQIGVDAGVCSFEALLRWTQPGGVLPPALFLPVAEQIGLDRTLDDWVLNRSCRQLRQWRDEGVVTRVSVNVSQRQLVSDDYPSTVLAALRGTALDPGQLELEFREDDLLQNWQRSVRTLERLHEIGTPVWIDDFSSSTLPLQLLRSLPVHGVKLDGSLTRHVATDAGSRRRVSGIIAGVRGMGRDVSIKGVETPAQYDWLGRQGCDRLQGYLFGRPAPAEELSDWLAATLEASLV